MSVNNIPASDLTDPHLAYVREVTPSADGCEDCLMTGSAANASGRERKWWLLLLSGILSIIAGVLTFPKL